MVWSLAVRSSCMLVWLVMSVSWTHVSGQHSPIRLFSDISKAKASNVYTGVYSADTPVSYLVNESRGLSYLPFCQHGQPGSRFMLELYRTDTNTVITRSNGSVAIGKRIYWPPSALYPSDSATYQCRSSLTDVADNSFLLSVVVSVNITHLDIGNVFVNRSFLVTCCANGYPEPSVAINGTGPSYVNTTNSSGIVTTCRTVNWSAPVKYGKVYVMCKAELAPFNCTAEPSAAHTLCAATRTKTNATKTTIANVVSTSTSTSASSTAQSTPQTSVSSILSPSTSKVTTQGTTSATTKPSSSSVAVIAGSVTGGLVIVALIIGIGARIPEYE